MRYENTDNHSQDFIALCRELDDFLNRVAGGEENRAQYIPYNQLDDVCDVIIAYDGHCPVGCAGLKHYNQTVGEVKRVFVKSAYRGRGIAKRIMALLEQCAKEKGYHKLILESGEPLISAMQLYRRTGYRVVPNYGQYKDMTDSVCMEKLL